MRFSNAFNTADPTQKLQDPEPSFINENWIFTEIPALNGVKRNEAHVIPLSVMVGSEMADGVTTQRGATYVFNVCVYPESLATPSGLCGFPSPIPRDEIRSKLHGKRISKIYVEVV
jgi:hypothetical protein